jgi:hypothetical protein
MFPARIQTLDNGVWLYRGVENGVTAEESRVIEDDAACVKLFNTEFWFEEQEIMMVIKRVMKERGKLNLEEHFKQLLQSRTRDSRDFKGTKVEPLLHADQKHWNELTRNWNIKLEMRSLYEKSSVKSDSGGYAAFLQG